MVSSSAVVSSVLLLAAPGAFGHGYLNKPPARNVVMNSDYCKQCLAAGGPGTVYPSGNHGLCGDPYAMPEPRKHEAGGIYYNGGESTATYSEGDIVDFNVVLTAYHKGDFRFRVCRIEGTTPEDERDQLTEQCFDQHVLKQADVTSAQSPGTARYFIGPSSDNWNYNIKYQLPDGLSCDGISARCVLQWHYVTGNSCDPPGTPAQYGSAQLPVCSSGDGAVPEEFWNCADITINPRDGPVPSPPEPVPSPPEPVPSPPEPVPSPPVDPSDPTSFCQGKPNGSYADVSSDCEKYIVCDVTGAFLMPCPAGLAYNEAGNYCDWPSNVECK